MSVFTVSVLLSAALCKVQTAAIYCAVGLPAMRARTTLIVLKQAAYGATTPNGYEQAGFDPNSGQLHAGAGFEQSAFQAGWIEQQQAAGAGYKAEDFTGAVSAAANGADVPVSTAGVPQEA